MSRHPRGAVLALIAIFAAFATIAPLATIGAEEPKAEQATPSEGKADHHSSNVRYEDMKWERIVPELGEKSSEITILRVHPETKATHLMIRVPPNTHVPKHWHSANETHTIVKGVFIMECEGKRETLGAGSWNYIPAKMHHEAWTKPDEGALLFITVDSAWDINWVGAPPKPSDFIGGRKD